MSSRIGVGAGIAREVVVNSNVTIGDYSYLNQGVIVSSGSIGKFCSVAPRAQIGPEEHPVDLVSTSPHVYLPMIKRNPSLGVEEFSSPPRIGNDVWIGSAAIVLQGVSIGDGAIVGAGSVVTRDVPPYAVAVGVPARILRYRFSPVIVRALLLLAWWDRHDSDPRLIQRLADSGTELGTALEKELQALGLKPS